MTVEAEANDVELTDQLSHPRVDHDGRRSGGRAFGLRRSTLGGL